METALKFKFTQHDHLKQMLLDTGNAELLEVCSCHDTPYLCTPSQGGWIFPPGFATGLVLGGRRGRHGKQRVGQGADALARRAPCVFLPIPLRLAQRFGWHFMLKGGLSLLTGNEANGDTPTPSITPTSASKSSATSTRSHRSQGHSGKDKCQAVAVQ